MVATPDNITLPGLAGHGRVSRRIQDHCGVLKRAESGKRDYSRPLLSELDVRVALHPAQAWNNAPGCACGAPLTGRGFETVRPLA